MMIEIPPEVDLVALGYTAQAFKARGKFIASINNAHDYYQFQPDLICAMDDLERDVEDHPRYVESITQAGVPVLTTGQKEQWPATLAYPLAEVIDWLELPVISASKILSNTINYTLAYLGYAGAKNINLWGVEFVNPDSRGIVQRQRNFLDRRKWPDWTIFYMEALIRAPQEPGLDGCMYLLGLLHARGVLIGLPIGDQMQTTLLDMDRPSFFYGYQEQPYEL